MSRRVPDERILLPSCKKCNDWMFPSLLWAYPVDAVVWVCLNGCGVLVLGHAQERPEVEDMGVLGGLGMWAAAQRTDE